MLRICLPADAEFAERLGALARRTAELPAAVETAARAAIAEVRAGGDEAVRALTSRFEGRALPALELPRAQWQAAASAQGGHDRRLDPLGGGRFHGGNDLPDEVVDQRLQVRFWG